MSYIEYLKTNAVDKGQINGYDYFIVSAPMDNALNGYIVFPEKPVIENGYDGIITYVPVHGGITLCRHEEEGSVYGFDTVHYNSHEYPRTDVEWIKGQIEVMLNGILKAKEVEQKYLDSTNNEDRAECAQLVQDIQPSEGQNFGVMLNLLSGQL